MLYIVEENAFTQNCEEHRVMFFLSDIQWIAFIGISSVMSYPVEQEEIILKEWLSFHVGDTLWTEGFSLFWGKLKTRINKSVTNYGLIPLVL